MPDLADDTNERRLLSAFQRIGAAMEGEVGSGPAAPVAGVEPDYAPLPRLPDRRRRLGRPLVLAAGVLAAVVGAGLVVAVANDAPSPSRTASPPVSTVPDPPDEDALRLVTRPGFGIGVSTDDTGAACATAMIADQAGSGQVCAPPAGLVERPASSFVDVIGSPLVQVVVIADPSRTVEISVDGDVWTTVTAETDGVAVEPVEGLGQAVTVLGFELSTEDLPATSDGATVQVRYRDV